MDIEEKLLKLIKSRKNGVLQNELWKKAKIDSSKCFRILAKLEKEGKISRVGRQSKNLFCWDEIPGIDSAKLIKFLKQNFSIDWAETAKIEKIDDGSTIKVSTEKNFLSLRLNNEKTRVMLKINDGRTDEFIVKMENGKLNLYELNKGQITYVVRYVEKKEPDVVSEKLNNLEQFDPMLNKLIEESIHPASVNDQATKDDILGFEPYVKAIADFLTNTSTKPPLTLSIEGQWGTGKSSFMLQLREILDSKKQLTVKFNAWRHDKEEALWAAFALDFIHQISRRLPLRRRLYGHANLLFHRLRWKNGWLDVFRVFFILLFILYAAITALPLLSEPLQTIVKWGGFAVLIAAALSFWKKLTDLIGNPIDIDLNRYLQSPDYEKRLAFIEHFHNDFKKIVDAYAGENKVYVFIDDLDRCEVPKASDLMQALNLMITDDPGLIFIIGMDREKIAASFAVKHEKLLPYLCSTKSPYEASSTPVDRFKGIEYGYAFIEKFIQLPFLVPEPTTPDLQRLLDEISNSNHDILSNKNEGRFSQVKNFLIYKILKATKPVSTEANSEHIPPELTEEQKLRRETIKVAVTTGDSQTIRDIAIMVAPALDNNPRRLKQFINLFRLKTFIASETGLFDTLGESSNEEGLTLEQLGKFVAISLKWPLLIMDLDANRNLLSRLQEMALYEHQKGKSEFTGYKQNDPIVHWSRDQKLMDLLLVGCTDPKTQQKCNLSKLNINKLLQVSPRLIRPLPVLKPEVITKSINEEQKTNVSNDVDNKRTSDYYRNMGDVYRTNGELDKALEYYGKALKLDEELGTKNGMAISYGNMGIIYRIKGELGKALEYYEKSLKLNQELGSKEGLAAIFGNMGNIYQTKGELDKALEFLHKSLKLNEELGSKEGMAKTFGNMGNIYHIKNEFDKALEFYRNALKLDEELGSKEGLAAIFGNMGNVYRIKGELDKALEFLDKSLKLNEELGRKEGIAVQLGNIGIVYKIKGELEKALEFYEKALKLNEELGSKEGMAIQLGNIGDVYRTRQEPDKALEYYGKALKIFKEIGIRIEEARTLMDIGDILVSKYQKERAIDYYLEAQELAAESPPLFKAINKKVNELLGTVGDKSL